MKKMFAVVVAGMLLGSAVSASAQMKMAVGLKGGLAMGTMYGKDVDSVVKLLKATKGLRLGMDIGAALAINFTDLVGLSLEAHYAQKGMKIKSTEETMGVKVEEEVTTKFDYIDIPVLLVISPMQGSIAPYLYAGPQVSIKASAKVKVHASSGGVSMDTVMDVNKETAGVDFGIAAGIGLGIAAGPGKVLIEYRFGMGFLTVDSGKSSAREEKDVIKNMVPATISAGYLFNL